MGMLFLSASLSLGATTPGMRIDRRQDPHAAQKLVLGHYVDNRICGRILWTEYRAVSLWQCRGGRCLGLIDLGLILHRVYKPLAYITGVYRLFSDLAQSDDGILVIFDVDGHVRSVRERACAVRC
jgi:hypothetical protein